MALLMICSEHCVYVGGTYAARKIFPSGFQQILNFFFFSWTIFISSASSQMLAGVVGPLLVVVLIGSGVKGGFFQVGHIPNVIKMGIPQKEGGQSHLKF